MRILAVLRSHGTSVGAHAVCELARSARDSVEDVEPGQIAGEGSRAI